MNEKAEKAEIDPDQLRILGEETEGFPRNRRNFSSPTWAWNDPPEELKFLPEQTDREEFSEKIKIFDKPETPGKKDTA